MPSRDWRAYLAAARDRLVSLAWIVGFLAVVGALYWWGYRGPSEVHRQNQGAKTECSYAQPSEKNAHKLAKRTLVVVCLNERASNATQDAANADQDPPKDIGPLSRFVARKIVSDPIAIFTAVLALLTWRLIVVGRYQHRVAIDAADAAMKAAIATERAVELTVRPWMKNEITIGGPLRIDEHGAWLTIKIKSLNVGNAPAVGITAHLDMFPYDKGVPPGRILANGIRAFAKGPRDHGDTAFPNEPVEINYLAKIDRPQLDRAIEAQASAPHPQTEIYVVGFVGYYGAGDRMLLSKFVFELIRPTEKEGLFRRVDLTAALVPREELALKSSWIFGVSAADYGQQTT